MICTAGTIHKVKITGYTHEGAGVGRVNGQVVFVPGALAAEEVVVLITGKKGGVLRGKLLEILVPNHHRVSPPCPVYSGCGGCSLQHVSYPEQLNIKKQIVEDALQRLGKFADIPVLPVLGMDNPWCYRNKGQFQVGIKEGRVALGFFAEDTHTIAPQPCYHLFSSEVARLLVFLQELLSDYEIKVAQRDGMGLRHVLIRESRFNNEMLVVFITKGQFSEAIDKIAREICRNFPKVVGVCENYNEKKAGFILGEETRIILGKDHLEDKLGPFVFSLSIPSFFQVNNSQAEVVYEKAVRYARLTGEEKVVDAYCGTGALTLFLAQGAKMVIGIETAAAAVNDAIRNAQANKTENVEFIEERVEKVLPDLVAKGMRPDVLVVDPPRRGCDKVLLQSIINAEIPRVVYISCNPATMARDLKILHEGGFSVIEVQPVDMFPQTYHVEVIVGIQRSDL